MSYQTFKQKRDDLVTQFHDSNLQNKDILCIEDYDKLLRFIDEYEELTRQILQFIKQLESDNFLLGETPNKTNDQEDRKWLEHHLSLGE